MDQHGIERVLVLPPPGAVLNPSPQYFARQAQEFDEILAAIRQYPGRLYFGSGGHNLNAMIHATPASAVTNEVRAAFRREAEALVRAGARAFGEIASLHIAPHAFDQTAPDHPLFLLLAEIAAENDIPIDLHMEAVVRTEEMPEGLWRNWADRTLEEKITGLERLLNHDTRARIVWQHLGWDFLGTRTPDLARRLLRAHSNLYFAIRAHGDRVNMMTGRPLPNRVHDDAGNVRPEWLALFGEFPDRFVVGSDEFVGPEGVLQGQGTQTSFHSTWSLIPRLPPDLAGKIGRENATQIYGL